MLTSVVRMAANQGQHWSYVEINALLDIWADEKIQSELRGAYRNNAIFRKISAALTRRLTDLRNIFL